MMFNSYVVVWKEELIWAAITFAVFMGGAFIATDSTPVEGWGAWAGATSMAGLRVVVVGLVKTGSKWLLKHPEAE